MFLRLVTELIGADEVIVLAGDDTLAKKTGRKIYGAGYWRDGVLSTPRQVVTRWGVNFVTLGLVVRCPLWPRRDICFPFLVRLHRKEKTFDKPQEYQTSPQLLVEMVRLVAGWLPDRTFYLAVDGGYANEVVFEGLPANVTQFSRTRADISLFGLKPPPSGKRGHPRTKGDPTSKPRERVTDATTDMDVLNRGDVRAGGGGGGRDLGWVVVQSRQRPSGAVCPSVRDRGRSWPDCQILIHHLWKAYRKTTEAEFRAALSRIPALAAHLTLPDSVRVKTLELSAKVAHLAVAYQFPGAHRTSNAVDRLINHQDRVLVAHQYFHGTPDSARLSARAMALISNFHPFGRRTHDQFPDKISPFVTLNGFQYHSHWLRNLLIASSRGGNPPKHKIR